MGRLPQQENAERSVLCGAWSRFAMRFLPESPHKSPSVVTVRLRQRALQHPHRDRVATSAKSRCTRALILNIEICVWARKGSHAVSHLPSRAFSCPRCRRRVASHLFEQPRHVHWHRAGLVKAPTGCSNEVRTAPIIGMMNSDGDDDGCCAFTVAKRTPRATRLLLGEGEVHLAE